MTIKTHTIKGLDWTIYAAELGWKKQNRGRALSIDYCNLRDVFELGNVDIIRLLTGGIKIQFWIHGMLELVVKGDSFVDMLDVIDRARELLSGDVTSGWFMDAMGMTQIIEADKALFALRSSVLDQRHILSSAQRLTYRTPTGGQGQP